MNFYEESLPVLDYLWINGYYLEKINIGENALPLLRTYYLSGGSSNLKSIELPFKKLENLNIDLPDSIESIEISNFENLQELILSSSSDIDVSISNLPNLNYLDLNCYKLKDIPNIKFNTLTNLQKLVLYLDIENIDFSAIEFKNLRELCIYDWSLSSLKLNKLENLDKFSLNCPNINENIINEIYKLSTIKRLDIYANSISELKTGTEKDNESKFPNLQNLKIEVDEIQNLEIVNLSNLTNIEIVNNTILGSMNNIKIENLENLTKLEIFSPAISGSMNNIKVENLENLKKCYICFSNTITNLDITSLSNSKKLEILTIVAGKMSSIDLTPIGKLRNLGGLTIAIDELENVPDVTQLKKLVNLQYLYVGYNQSKFEEVQNEILSVTFEYDDLPLFASEIQGQGNFLYGFTFEKSGDSVATFKEKFDYSNYIISEQLSNPNIKLYNQNGEELKEEQIVGTADKIKIFDGEEEKTEFTIVYYGDVNGDGKINAIDSLTIVKNKLTNEGDSDYFRFSNAFMEEAGKILTTATTPSATDGLAIVKHALELIQIDQYK